MPPAAAPAADVSPLRVDGTKSQFADRRGKLSCAANVLEFFLAFARGERIDSPEAMDRILDKGLETYQTIRNIPKGIWDNAKNSKQPLDPGHFQPLDWFNCLTFAQGKIKEERGFQANILLPTVLEERGTDGFPVFKYQSISEEDFELVFAPLICHAEASETSAPILAAVTVQPENPNFVAETYGIIVQKENGSVIIRMFNSHGNDPTGNGVAALTEFRQLETFRRHFSSLVQTRDFNNGDPHRAHIARVDVNRCSIQKPVHPRDSSPSSDVPPKKQKSEEKKSSDMDTMD